MVKGFVLYLSAALHLYCLGIGPAHASETAGVGKFRVDITGISDVAVMQNVQAGMELYQRSLVSASRTPTPHYDWLRLLDSAPQEVKTAVKPYGYYTAEVTVTVGKNNRVTVAVELGEPIIVQSVELNVDGDADDDPEVQRWRNAFPLAPGDRLIQPSYENAKSEISKLLRRFGYFDASFQEQALIVDLPARSARIRLRIDSGSRYRYGSYEIVWRDPTQEDIYTEELVRSYLPITPGDYFDLRYLEKLQSELTSSGYFSYAEIRPVIAQASDAQMPLSVTLEAPTRLAYGASIGIGTDTGLRAGLGFEDRRFNRHGHRAGAQVQGSEIRRSVLASYTVPSDGSSRDGFIISASFRDEDSDARLSETLTAGIDFNSSLSERTQFSYGLQFRDEQFVTGGAVTNSQLLVPTLSWQTVAADNLRAPERGYRLSAKLSGASEDLGSDLSFMQINIDAKSVYRFGIGRLLARAEVGQTLIDDDDLLPASLTYFTGGDHTVRGYDFESIGVAAGDDDLQGGKNLVTASIEFERSVRGALSVAAFVDAGDAYDDELDLKLGIGIGARWRLPFGAIRLDVAQAQDLPGKPSRLHFTFGTDL